MAARYYFRFRAIALTLRARVHSQPLIYFTVLYTASVNMSVVHGPVVAPQRPS